MNPVRDLSACRTRICKRCYFNDHPHCQHVVKCPGQPERACACCGGKP
jgi:hypothetical protein